MKTILLNNQSRDYFLNSIKDTITKKEASHKEKLLLLKKLLSELFKQFTSAEQQYFSSDFARITFFFDKNRNNLHLASNIRKLNHFLTTFTKSELTIDDDIIYSSSCLIELLILEYSDEPDLTESFNQTKLQDLSFLSSVDPTVKIKVIEKISGVVNEIHADAKIIEIETSEFDSILFKPGIDWEELLIQVKKGNNLNLINVILKDEFYTTTYNSLVVIEPDYLYDASEIAATFYSSGFVSQYFIYQKLIRSKPNLKMILGNIINYLFDALLFNSEEDFETIYLNALKYKPLQIFAIAKLQPEAKTALRKSAKIHFDNLKNIVGLYQNKLKSIEPHFISPLYGFQGRLDLMLEYIGDNNRKDVIELKSGKVPSIDEKFFSHGTVIKTGLYLNHFAQATIYNLLLDSTFRKRTGSSQILYSSDNINPLRNAPNVVNIKVEMIKARNKAIVSEQRLCNDDNFISQIDLTEQVNIPPWVRDDISSFTGFYGKLPQLEQTYFDHWIKFIYNELFSARIGTSNDKLCYANLWKSNPEEKRMNNSIISDMLIDVGKSDFEKMHLHFDIGEDTIQLYPFRKGDLCIIYPEQNETDFNPKNGRLIKGSIKDISANSVTLTLRNKLEFNIFRNIKQKWILESDYTDASIKSLFASIFIFLNSSQEKKSLILGLIESKTNEVFKVNYNYLSEQQNNILNAALNANDYFLIQGPPGTGKTTFLLRAIVESLYFNTDTNILVLAYTNRAVDEICTALERIDFKTDSERAFPEFIRLGNKDSSPHKKYLISELIENTDINVAFHELNKTRIVVATTSFVLSNMEIFDIKQFSSAIVDEASQIIEVNLIGILSRVEKFILIGDEKQLPAIVIQDSEKTKITEPALKSINLNNLNISLFERLLSVCKQNDWSKSYDMLVYQARMHSDLMKITNSLFYDNRLKVYGDDWQTSNDNIFSKFQSNGEDSTSGIIISILSKHRFTFVDVPDELHSKYNLQEAELVIKLVNTIKTVYKNNFNNDSLGIISPFRMQCSIIFKMLDDNTRKVVTIDTVEKFQGSQRDIIIYTLATNNQYLLNNVQSVSTVDGKIIDKKLNVSLTRAKTHLIMLGSASVLNNSIFYKHLIEYAQSQNAYFNIDEII